MGLKNKKWNSEPAKKGRSWENPQALGWYPVKLYSKNKEEQEIGEDL